MVTPTPPPTPMYDRVPDKYCSCCKLPAPRYFSKVYKQGKEDIYCSRTCYEQSQKEKQQYERKDLEND